MTNETKQTAVEWLYNELTKVWYDVNSSKELLQQAKEMEKKQIELSNECGFKDGCLYANGEKWAFESPEQYYNETYGGKNEK